MRTAATTYSLEIWMSPIDRSGRRTAHVSHPAAGRLRCRFQLQLSSGVDVVPCTNSTGGRSVWLNTAGQPSAPSACAFATDRAGPDDCAREVPGSQPVVATNRITMVTIARVTLARRSAGAHGP